MHGTNSVQTNTALVYNSLTLPLNLKKGQKHYKITDLDNYFGLASREYSVHSVSNFNSWYCVDPRKVEIFVQTWFHD